MAVKTAAQKAAEKAAKDAQKAAGQGGDPRRTAAIAKLDAIGLAYDKSESTENLETLIHNHQNPTDQKPLAAKAPTDTSDEFEVGDPEELRPKTLPLVIKPKGGGDWKNAAQAEWARILNGYAYQNPKKWNKKKAHLLGVLSQLGALGADEADEKLLTLKGAEFGVKVTNERAKNVTA